MSEKHDHIVCSKTQNGICICDSVKFEASITFPHEISDELYSEITRKIDIKFKSFTSAHTKLERTIYIIIAETTNVPLIKENRKELVEIFMEYDYEKIAVGNICNPNF